MRAIRTKAGMLLIGLALAGSGAVQAQDTPVPRPYPQVTSAEAFSTEYGVRLIDELVGNLEASVDRTCLAERNIAAPGRERAADWLVRYGQRVLDLEEEANNSRDRAVIPQFVESSGAGAPAELDALSRHPLVRRSVAISTPSRRDAAADAIAEALDQHLAHGGAPLARPLSPASTGVRELADMRDERSWAVIDAREQFGREHGNVPEMQRFANLSTAWWEAQVSVPQPVSDSHRAFDGIIAELRANCVGGR